MSKTTTADATKLPSKSAILWLQSLLRERLYKGLVLRLNVSEGLWELTLPNESRVITLSVNKSFYELGPQPNLPCAKWIAASEGFSTLETHLPAPGLLEVNKPLFHYTIDGFQVLYDIVGLTYWILARCEEINPPSELLDCHSRFSAFNSHALLYDYLERPIVDEWLEVLRQVMHRMWPRVSLLQHRFKVVVSHDVDAPSAYAFGSKRCLARSMVRDLLKWRDLDRAASAPWIRLKSRYQLHPRDPFNTFDWLMDTSEAAGISSAFYFICGRTNPSLDAQYEPEHPAIRCLMRRIHERGHEIGLHPSYGTYDHPERIALEGQRLRRICEEEGIKQSQWGGRMHYLRWQWPTTAYGWEQTGFQYDSSLSYADRPGFRCGTCHPFSMFDPVAQRLLRLIQRPLIVMECSVADRRNLGLGYGSEARAVILKLKNQCQRVQGEFTMLWHNNRIGSAESQRLYLEVLG